MTIIRPIQKVGRLNPRMENVMIDFAAFESGLSPATSPRGMPAATAMITAASASSSVAGMRSRIKPSAGRLNTKEWPRSPGSALTRKVRY